MSKVILGAPGNDLKSFLNHISFDLKKRRIEYFVVGFFNANDQPIGMIETKGRSSWVECNSNKIIDTARKLKATGVCLLHNHPCKSGDIILIIAGPPPSPFSSFPCT
jgi:DNA repair protein RadC